MLENYNSKQAFQYEKLSPDEQKRRGILGRLVGIIADFKNATRNERSYSEQLWDNAFEDPIIKEKLENRCFFGELGHPVDRSEVDMEKIAICLAEKPKKGNDGKLRGVFDILDTPNGRILKTLCDYGCKIGVSTRGSGDVHEGYDGRNEVDPKTFELECWDAVLIPAVKDARMSYVTESLEGKTLKKALKEELENATIDTRKIMEDTLNNLDISLDDKESEDDIDSNSTTKSEVDNTESNIVAELEESLKQNIEQQGRIKELQEQLAVSYTEVSALRSKEDSFKETFRKSAELTKKVQSLEKRISNLQRIIEQKESDIKAQNSQITLLTEKLTRANESKNLLTENLNNNKNQIKNSEMELNSIKNKLEENNKSFTQEKQQLIEQIQSLKTDSKVKNEEYKKQLNKANSIVEKYRKGMKEALLRYISSQATRYGISKEEVINKLPENYSFDEIDSICESLCNYSLGINKLPFAVNKPIKMKITESSKPTLLNYVENDGDDVDEGLLSLVRSKLGK